MKTTTKYILLTSIATLTTTTILAQEAQTNDNSRNWQDNESLFLSQAVEHVAKDSGFTPIASWTGEYWSNLEGGTKTGSEWDSLITFGFEQDLSKPTNKNWGTFGITAFWYTQSGDIMENICSTPHATTGHAASNIFSGEMVRVFEIFYKNEFETKNGTFGFRIGQLAADEDFMGMDYSDLFLNANLGAIPTNAGMELFGSNGSWAFSQYALATLGATIYWNNDNLDAIVGIYNGDAGRDVSSNHGFDYDIRNVAVWYQVGYNYELFDLAGRFQFGGNYHNGKFENKYTGEAERNFYSFYLGLQQDFIADKDGNAILGGFVRIAYTPQEEISGCDKYIDCGLNWFAPLPCRDDDVLGIAFSGMRLGEQYYHYDNLVEITYKAQITKAIAIQPTFQTYLNAKNENDKTNVAYVFGVRAEINF